MGTHTAFTMKTKTAFVLALCAVAIAAVPDSDIVPEDTHHDHLRDIRSAMDALTHLPHTETARKDAHLRELRFAVDALTAKVNTMALKLQTDPPSEGMMSLVQMLPKTLLTRDVAKPTEHGALDEKLHQRSQKFLAMRTAIKDKIASQRDSKTRGATLEKSAKDVKNKREHMSGTSKTTDHLGRIGGQCYEEIEDYVLGLAEFLDDFKSDVDSLLQQLKRIILKSSSGCNVLTDLTEGKIKETCTQQATKRLTATTTYTKSVQDIKKSLGNTNTIQNMDAELHKLVMAERKCNGARTRALLETAVKISEVVHKHLRIFKDEVDGFCQVVKNAEAPKKVVWNKMVQSGATRTAIFKPGMQGTTFEFEGDKELQEKVCKKQQGPARYKAFYTWLFEVSFGQFSKKIFPFFEYKSNKVSIKKLDFQDSTRMQMGPEAFAEHMAKKYITTIKGAAWKWLSSIDTYYNKHSVTKGDWQDKQCVTDSGLGQMYLKKYSKVWPTCWDMFQAAKVVKDNKSDFWNYGKFTQASSLM